MDNNEWHDMWPKKIYVYGGIYGKCIDLVLLHLYLDKYVALSIEVVRRIRIKERERNREIYLPKNCEKIIKMATKILRIFQMYQNTFVNKTCNILSHILYAVKRFLNNWYVPTEHESKAWDSQFGRLLET